MMSVSNFGLRFEDRDEFQRRKIAEKIIAMLTSSISVSPMVIDGEWGAGKTEFCQKLMNLMLETSELHPVYIDAFQADHADQPLMTILSEILKLAPDDKTRKDLTKKALPAIKFGLNVAGKAAVSHLLRQDTESLIEDYEDAIRDATDQIINASVEALLEEHVKAEESIDALRQVLNQFAQKKPLVIFIDELDRCRPDFAVRVLEILKHTFSIEFVQFVLVTNRRQLLASINCSSSDLI